MEVNGHIPTYHPNFFPEDFEKVMSHKLELSNIIHKEFLNEPEIVLVEELNWMDKILDWFKLIINRNHKIKL